MVHWGQAARSKDRRLLHRFDHGTDCSDAEGLAQACNQHVYGQLKPPTYNLSAISTPVALFQGAPALAAGPVGADIIFNISSRITCVLSNIYHSNVYRFGVCSLPHPHPLTS